MPKYDENYIMRVYKEFSVDYFSDTKYKKITLEISYKGQILCQLNKDKGDDDIEIEFYYDFRELPINVEFKFPLDEFITLLNEQRQALISS